MVMPQTTPNWEMASLRSHQVAQQGIEPHRQGDGGHPAAADPRRLARAGQPKTAHAPPVEEGKGQGGKNLAQHHSGHNQPHHPLGILGQKQHQQPQNSRRAHQLLQQLDCGGRPHQAAAVKDMLVQVLYPGQSRAGHQQDQAELGAGVPEKGGGNKVRPKDQNGSHRKQQQKEGPQTGVQRLLGRAAVAQGQVLGGQVGRGGRQPHCGEGQHHRGHGHHQLVQPHDLRPRQAG